MIKRLKIKNFKSFKDIDVKLGNFNVIIGANASGKSNFINAIKFLRDIAKSGIEKAIDGQKGIRYLQNFNLGNSEYLSFEFESVFEKCIFRDINEDFKQFYEIRIKNQKYIFELKLDKDNKFRIITDKAITLFNADSSPIFADKNQKINFNLGELVLEHRDKGLIIKYKVDDKDIEQMLNQNINTGGIRLSPNSLILSLPIFGIVIWDTKFYRDIFISDFDFKLLQKSVPISEKKELEEDASNLAVVLSQILSDETKKKKLINIVKFTLGFVEDVNVEEFLSGALIFKLKELYSKEHIPSFLLSEGTINIIALLIIAYFQDNSMIIFDEITRGIHPYLLSRILSVLKEVSKEKQIIITTHSPEVLKYIDIEDLLLVSRDKEGYSTISRPAHQEDVKIFLKNNIGIDDLFVKNLLKTPL